jgi:hypothetical protein
MLVMIGKLSTLLDRPAATKESSPALAWQTERRFVRFSVGRKHVTTTRRTAGRPALRIGAAALAGLLALSTAPLAGAADDPPVPVADPIAGDGFCDGAPSNNPFTDIGTEPAGTRAVILCLVATELTTGTTPTTYTPGGTVTRRQMALFIERLADLADEHERADLEELPEWDGTSDFSDVVVGDDPGAEAIGRLSQADIVGGFPDGTYRPNAPVSRRQMAAFVNRLQEYLAGDRFEATGQYFDDLGGESPEARANLNAMAEVGIFQGDGQGNVTPGGNLSRRQMANILMRHAQVNYSLGVIDSPFNPLPPSRTELPELIRAERLATVTAADATEDRPAGTRVRFTFDEEVASPSAAQLRVYDWEGTVIQSDDDSEPFPYVEPTGRSVVALFPDLATEAQAESLTLAAAARGAVRDADGDQNVEGSAPIGTSGTVNVREPRTTTAPDVQGITELRQVAASTFPPSEASTAIDITFDQVAYVQDASSFLLVPVQAGPAVTCAGPNPLFPSPSGESSPGGNGTATFTIVCPIPQNRPEWSSSNVARIVVPEGTVHSAPLGGSSNPLQVTQFGAAQDMATRPNLVSATRIPAATDTATVRFTFDEAITSATASGFGIYRANSDVDEAATSSTAQVSPTDPRQVTVTFEAEAVDLAVGAFVEAGAVINTQGQANLDDEVGIENVPTVERTPGRTQAPDLLSVTLANPGGNGWQATYTFDAPIVNSSGNAIGNTNHQSLVLYQADGTRLTCASADARTYAAASPNQVTCEAYSSGGSTATSLQVGTSVLGAVGRSAAFTPYGGTNISNPEGARPTTGGA